MKSISEAPRRRVVRSEREEPIYTESQVRAKVKKAQSETLALSQAAPKEVYRDPLGYTHRVETGPVPQGVLLSTHSALEGIKAKLESMALLGNLELLYFETTVNRPRERMYELVFFVELSGGRRSQYIRHISYEAVEAYSRNEDRYARVDRERMVITTELMCEIVGSGLFDDVANAHGYIAILNAVHAGAEYMRTRNAPIHILESSINLYGAMVARVNAVVGVGNG